MYKKYIYIYDIYMCIYIYYIYIYIERERERERERLKTSPKCPRQHRVPTAHVMSRKAAGSTPVQAVAFINNICVYIYIY